MLFWKCLLFECWIVVVLSLDCEYVYIVLYSLEERHASKKFIVYKVTTWQQFTEQYGQTYTQQLYKHHNKSWDVRLHREARCNQGKGGCHRHGAAGTRKICVRCATSAVQLLQHLLGYCRSISHSSQEPGGTGRQCEYLAYNVFRNLLGLLTFWESVALLPLSESVCRWCRRLVEEG